MDSMSTFTVYAQAAALGAVTGMRSVLGIALLALAAHHGRFGTGVGWPWRVLRSTEAMVGLGVTALLEIAADKLPFVPSRLSPGPFGARLLLGAVCGAYVCANAEQSSIIGAFIGAVTAAGSALVGNRARAYATRETKRPDVVWARVEDGVAIVLGMVALHGPLFGDG